MEKKLSVNKIAKLEAPSMNAELNRHILCLSSLGHSATEEKKSSIYLSDKASNETVLTTTTTGDIYEKKVLPRGTEVTLMAYWHQANTTVFNGEAQFSVLNDTGDELFLYVNKSFKTHNQEYSLTGKYETTSSKINLVKTILFEIPEKNIKIMQSNKPVLKPLTQEEAEVRLMTDKDLLAYFDEAEDIDFVTALNKHYTKLRGLFGNDWTQNYLISVEDTVCKANGYVSEKIDYDSSVCYFVNSSQKYYDKNATLSATTLSEYEYTLNLPIVIRIKNREKVFLDEFNEETKQWRTISLTQKDKETQIKR